MNLSEEMLNKKNWAVVGVNEKKDKWGNRLYNVLKDNDYKVYGVNPNYDEIDGDKIYHSLKDIGEDVDVIDMVVPPKIALSTIEEAKELGIEYIFFQPGTFNKDVIAKTEELGLKYVAGECVYDILKNRP